MELFGEGRKQGKEGEKMTVGIPSESIATKRKGSVMENYT